MTCFWHFLTLVTPKNREGSIVGKQAKSGAQGVKRKAINIHGAWPTFSESTAVFLCNCLMKENKNARFDSNARMQLKRQYNIEVGIRILLYGNAEHFAELLPVGN